MIDIDNLILGAGIAGLAVGQKLLERGDKYIILEKETSHGGLCASFNIEGFWFDYYIHMSFTNDENVRRFFDVTPYLAHEPNPYNYYHGTWIKHPAINNLFPLSDKEKQRIIEGLECREQYKDTYSDDYEKWLRYQFGDYFAEHFSIVYTHKFWCEEPQMMGTKWIENRIYQPSIHEIITGMNTDETPNTYYAKEMRYPRIGGYASFLDSFAHLDKIRTNERVIKIDPVNKCVITDKDTYRYKELYSSIPLPDVCSLLSKNSIDIECMRKAVTNLHWTGGYIVSLGIRGELNRKDIWDYVYDDDIITSRLYAPSLMSPCSAPEGCSSLQAEIYTKDGRKLPYEDEDILKKTISQLSNIGIFENKDVVVKDIRFRPYCNILYDHVIYKNRDIAMKVLQKNEIKPIGRFGKWEYLWSDQAFLSGYNAV